MLYIVNKKKLKTFSGSVLCNEKKRSIFAPAKGLKL